MSIASRTGESLVEQDGEAVDWTTEAEQLAAEFFDALQRMYIRAGEPSLRTVAARSDRLSASNLSALFSGRRTALPNYEVMTAAVSALLHGMSAAEKELELERWRERWIAAKYARKQAQKSAAEADQLPQAAHVVEKARLDAELILAEARAAAEKLVKQGRMEAERILEEATDQGTLLREAEIQKIIKAAVDAEREQVLKSQADAAGNGRISANLIDHDLRALRAYVERRVVPRDRADKIEKYLSGLDHISDDVRMTFHKATEYVQEQTRGLPEKPDRRMTWAPPRIVSAPGRDQRQI